MKTLNPSRVENHYDYWSSPPPSRSARCQFWIDQINAGWTKNRRIGQMGYDEAAEWFGVYLWEYLNVLQPLMSDWHKDHMSPHIVALRKSVTSANCPAAGQPDSLA